MSGLEAFIALVDVCQLDPARARKIMSWAVRTLTKVVAEGTGN